MGLYKRKSDGSYEDAVIVNSNTPPENNNVLWYDANMGVLKGYDFKNSEWKFLVKYGYGDFDNSGQGLWNWNIQIPISTPPSESIQYCVEINGDNIYVKSNNLTTNLITGTGGTTFWQNVSGVNDIRVFDENFIQNYFWIEEFDTTTQVAKIWVKLNAGQTMVGIAFGNPYAGVSEYNNGGNVFEFFDDFDGTNLDTNKWVIGSGAWTVSNSEVITYEPDAYFYSVQDISLTDYIVESKLYTESLVDMYFGCDSNGNGYMGRVECRSGCYNEILSVSGWTQWSDLYKSSTNSPTGYHKMTIIVHSGTADLYIDGQYQSGGTITVNTPFKVGIQSDGTQVGADKVDYIFIRKYLSSDLSFGTPKVDIF